MFPTPEKLRAAAAHARQLGNEYLAEGREGEARRSFARADFYEAQADFEELRIYRSSPVVMGDAA